MLRYTFIICISKLKFKHPIFIACNEFVSCLYIFLEILIITLIKLKRFYIFNMYNFDNKLHG